MKLMLVLISNTEIERDDIYDDYIEAKKRPHSSIGPIDLTGSRKLRDWALAGT